MQGKIIKGIAGFYYVYAEETDTFMNVRQRAFFQKPQSKAAGRGFGCN